MQVISVIVFALTVQVISSIVTVVEALLENPVPVKVIDSPPSTVPYRLLIPVKTGVRAESKVIGLKLEPLSWPWTVNFGVHA